MGILQSSLPPALKLEVRAAKKLSSFFMSHVCLPVTDKDESSVAAESAKVLTSEESTILKENISFEALREQALVNQKYIEAYADIDMKEARRGVAAAIELRDEALRKLKILQSGEKKLEKFEAEIRIRSTAKEHPATIEILEKNIKVNNANIRAYYNVVGEFSKTVNIKNYAISMQKQYKISAKTM